MRKTVCTLIGAVYMGKPAQVPKLARFNFKLKILPLLLFLTKFHFAFIWEPGWTA
jgi:hypothetical protein